MQEARDALAAMRAADLDVRELEAALAAWGEPWRMVVVGRTSVGKTTMVNALTGHAGPTGLGGVTKRSHQVRWGEVDVVDTIGIDGEALGIAQLRPILAEADSVLWVTDGLQPMTDTERNVVGETLVPGTQLHIAVSKLDVIDEAERDAVLDRVRALTETWEPTAVTPGGKAELDAEQLAAKPPSARRRRDLLAALRHADEALSEDALDPASLLERLRMEWRDLVRNAQKLTDADIEAGELPFKPAALRRLAREIRAARREFDEVLPALPGAPDLPEPRADEGSALTAIVSGLGGQHAARTAVRAEAGRLLLEGEVALQEWVAGATDPRLVAAREAVGTALAVL